MRLASGRLRKLCTLRRARSLLEAYLIGRVYGRINPRTRSHKGSTEMQSVLWGLREQFLRIELVNDCMGCWMRLQDYARCVWYPCALKDD